MQPTQEQWRVITGYEGQYEVSDQGRVRSLTRIVQGPHGDKLHRGRILKSWSRTRGYRDVQLWKNNEFERFGIHVLVAEAFIGPRPEGMVVRHLDDDAANNLVANLRWGTQSENIRDCVNLGNHHYAKRSHCKNGHEFTPENTKPRPKGGRWCRACLKIYGQRTKARNAAARLAA